MTAKKYTLDIIEGESKTDYVKRYKKYRIQKWYEETKEIRRLNNKKWKNDNKEKIEKQRKARREADIEKSRAKEREHAKKYHAQRIKYMKAYIKAHPEKFVDTKRKHSAKHRAAKIKATPLWANEEKIAEIYRLAVLLGKETGQKYHVDHIIPLQGKNVCGLHIETNLQVLRDIENMSKGNKYSEE